MRITKRRFLAFSCVLVLSVAGLVSMAGCAFVFDKIADTVLANEVRSDDREAPHTPYAIASSADNVQLLGGQGSGLSCSLPLGAQALAFTRTDSQAPIALQMRQACAFHDYCYRHGNATYGYSQADCDFMLQQHAFRLCKFINRQASVGECETDARKVTLGVRLGGFGSFKRARALDDEKASTFMEFDPYPVRSSSFRVARIADAPRQWVRDGLFAKAAYHFDIRPSGSLVHVLGWKPSGATVCSSFALPASYHAINGAPMVVRDAAGGEDWFVWWKRADLSATHGYFALLPPARAVRGDWVKVAGGFSVHDSSGQCESKALWPSNPGPADEQLAAFITIDDLEFSELHPVRGTETPGRLRLMGLRTHSCNKQDRSLCLVDVEFDLPRKGFLREPKSPTMYRASEPGCDQSAPGGQSRGGCDRYRNFVGAPQVVAHEDKPALVWTRRGDERGDGYESAATVRRFTIGSTREDIATDLGEMVLTEFPEASEPAFVINPVSAAPTFLSLVADGDRFRLMAQTAVSRGETSTVSALECFRHPDRSWLLRPPAMVADKQHAGRTHLVFTRVPIDAQATTPAAVLEVAVVTLINGSCAGMQDAAFPAFFKGFASKKELDAIAAVSRTSNDERVEAAKEALGQFAARVRGGQVILADLNGDGVPELLQLARMPGALGFQSAFLVGVADTSGLRFRLP